MGFGEDMTIYVSASDKHSFGARQDALATDPNLSLGVGLSKFYPFISERSKRGTINIYFNPNASFHLVKERDDWYTSVGAGLDYGRGGRSSSKMFHAYGAHLAGEVDPLNPSEHNSIRLGGFFLLGYAGDYGFEILSFLRAGLEFMENGSRSLFVSVEIGFGQNNS